MLKLTKGPGRKPKIWLPCCQRERRVACSAKRHGSNASVAHMGCKQAIKERTTTPTRAAVGGGAHMPPMTNVGTDTAFRHDHCKHFQKKVNIPWGQRSLMRSLPCTHPKEAVSEVRVHAGTTQVDFKVDMARNASHFAANWPTSRSNKFRQKIQKKKWRRPTHDFLHLNLKSLVRHLTNDHVS